MDGDVFVRYQSFKNGQELKAAIQKRVPSKIDIGPVYNVDPQKRAAYANQGGGFAPQERELVFDIDLTVRGDPAACPSVACLLVVSLWSPRPGSHAALSAHSPMLSLAHRIMTTCERVEKRYVVYRGHAGPVVCFSPRPISPTHQRTNAPHRRTSVANAGR